MMRNNHIAYRSMIGGFMMKKNLKRLMTAVLALCLLILSACTNSSPSTETEDAAKGNEAVKVVCENGIMLGNSTDESHPSKESRLQNLL